MAYILSRDGRNKGANLAFRKYKAYVDSTRNRFPPSALRLASSDWYFNFEDHRCPHDAWVEHFEFIEHASGERRESRYESLKVRLLGAYHDGRIELEYPRVYSYQLNATDVRGGHRDWLYDEFRVSERGTLIHEIEFADGARCAHWLIEASDMNFLWTPLP